jgi:hypothetical protein
VQIPAASAGYEGADPPPQAGPAALAVTAKGKAEGLLSEFSFLSVFFESGDNQSPGSGQTAKTGGAFPSKKKDEREEKSACTAILLPTTLTAADYQPFAFSLPVTGAPAGLAEQAEQAGNQEASVASETPLAEPKTEQDIRLSGFQAAQGACGDVAFTAMVAKSTGDEPAACAVPGSKQTAEKPQPSEEHGTKDLDTIRGPSRVVSDTRENEHPTGVVTAATRVSNDSPTPTVTSSPIPVHETSAANTTERAAAPKSAPRTEPTPVAGHRDRTPVDVAIRLHDAQDRSAQVRLVERAGELRVTVRSTDPDLVQSLRSGLDDLSSRLEMSGVKAHVFQPAGTAAAGHADLRQSSSDHGSGGRPFGESGGEEQKQQRQPERGNPDPQDWDGEFNGALGELSSQIGER